MYIETDDQTFKVSPGIYGTHSQNIFVYLKIRLGQALWCMPLILAHGKQRQEELCKFKCSLVYILRSSQD